LLKGASDTLFIECAFLTERSTSQPAEYGERDRSDQEKSGGKS
jgi:hypothetical protein